MDRSDVQAHFKKVLDAFEASLQELLDTSAAMKAGKKFASSGSGKIDGAAFNAWSEDFRVRVLACKQEHQEYLDGVFAHYYPQETIFTTPALFGLMDIVCFYELVPLCKKYRVILPEWLFEIKRSCEGVPMLPPEEAVLRGIRRDLRLIREGVGLLPATYALKDAALSREKIEEMKKSEEGEPLRAFDWAPVPEALATLSTEMPHLFPEPELRRVKDLAALTYPGIPVDSVRACYLASLVESPAPTDPKAPPARLRVLGLEYETREIALTERDRLATQLDHPPGRMAFAMQKNTVVVAVIYEGPPERVAAWQYLNTWFAMHME
ncbi:MAG: hypothetical protein HYY93_09535 [Planctomycetes bacterium]|nr:hypothetical protein [Planctomycetota bacterium]